MTLSLGALEQAVFIQRDNRFRAEIEMGGARYKAHVANSGRMQELLLPQAEVWVRRSDNPARKTPFDLVLVAHEGRLICLNAHLANELMAFWLAHELLPEWAGATSIRRERVWGESRFDFALEKQGEAWLIEVKSVNLVTHGVACFPDAPTVRGTRHLRELIAYQKGGGRSAVVFIVMGNDARDFAPNEATDPDFVAALTEAIAAGVAVFIYRTRVTVDGVSFDGRIDCAWSTPGALKE